jgi:hypothetical protein
MTNQPASSTRTIPGRPTHKIEVVSEEHHAFPANRPGQTDPTPNQNARTSSDTAPVPKSDARDRLNASRQAQQAAKQGRTPEQKILDQLPPGHPMRARIETHQASQQKAPVAKAAFSTRRKPTRLELERQRKGVDPETVNVKTQAETDPNFTTIGLPSQFAFYDFKQLTITQLKGIHQAKLSRAAKEKKIRYVVEAIGSTLGEGVSAFDLTPQDFYFLMYWHRLQSFPKNPQLIPYSCTNEDHIRRTILRTDHSDYLDPKTLDISTILNETTLKTEYLDGLDLSPFQELIDKYDLHVETMRDIVEFAELQEEEDYLDQQEQSEYGDDQTTASVEEESDESFSEVEWLQVRSVFLRRGPGRNTILERNEIVKQMSSDEIFELDKYIEAVTNYGVSEATVLRCKECGASHRVKLSVDALTFLP